MARFDGEPRRRMIVRLDQAQHDGIMAMGPERITREDTGEAFFITQRCEFDGLAWEHEVLSVREHPELGAGRARVLSLEGARQEPETEVSEEVRNALPLQD